MSSNSDDRGGNIDLAAAPFGMFLERLSAREPVPGGGAVAAAVGALGAALAQMCMRYSIRRKTDDEKRAAIEGFVARFESATGRMIESADNDARAYAELNRLQKLDEDDPERMAGWSDAVQAAIDVPWSVVQLARTLVKDLRGFAPLCNRWLLSDLAIAAILADAAARAAAWNVRVNLPLLADAEKRIRFDREMNEALTVIGDDARRVQQFAGGEASSE